MLNVRKKPNVSESLLKRLFKGETLEGYIEAARVRTLDTWTVKA